MLQRRWFCETFKDDIIVRSNLDKPPWHRSSFSFSFRDLNTSGMEDIYFRAKLYLKFILPEGIPVR